MAEEIVFNEQDSNILEYIEITNSGTGVLDAAKEMLILSDVNSNVPIIRPSYIPENSLNKRDNLLNYNSITYTSTLAVYSAISGLTPNFVFNSYTGTTAPNTYAKLKPYQTLTSSTNIIMNVNISENAILTLSHDAILTLTNLSNGSEGNIKIKQGISANTITIVPTPYIINDETTSIILRNGFGAITVLSYSYDGTTLLVASEITGMTTSWTNIVDKPSWLSGKTLDAFQTGHTHGQYELISNFNNFTGTTLPNNYYNKTQINIYTGTTIPNNYYNKNQTNILISGATSGLTSSWDSVTDKPAWLSGSTLSDFESEHNHSQYLLVNDFDSYSGNTGLQEITEIGAETNIESTFGNGIVLNKIRPTGDTINAIQINRSNGIDNIITIDSVSGLTGIGTTNPIGLVHAYGRDSGGNLLGIQSNAFIIDGLPNVDKDINWSENGIPKWLAETYRDENAKFWYLYNVESDNSPLTINETGVIGINKNTNILNYHSAMIVGNVLDDLIVGGVYTQNYISVYEIEIVGTSGITDNFRWRSSVDYGITYGTYSNVSGCTITPIELEYGVLVNFENITGHNTNDKWRFAAFSQIPQATLSITPMGFNEVQITNDYTASPIIYKDITSLANGGVYENEFTIFNTGTTGTIQAFYWGTLVKIDSIYFNLNVFGESIILITQYWDGSSWVALNYDNDNYIDGTDNLTKSGRIIWSPNVMPNWNISYMPDLIEDGYELYWMRIITTTNPTIAPIGKSISVGNDKRLSIYSSFNDYKPNYYVDSLGRVNIGGGNITGTNLLQVNKGENLSVVTDETQSLVEFDSEDSNVADLKIKLSSNNDLGAGLDLVKTRGTLSNPLDTISGDTLGHISFKGRFGTSNFLLSQISSNYVENGLIKNSNLSFYTTNNSILSEKLIIDHDGNSGFGITIPRATIDIKAGTTTNAPLNFNVGQLLASPQTGIIEYNGNHWFGTISGDTRKTFAFLESPVFSGNVSLPNTTCLNNINLYNFISNSGGTNNICKLNTSIFNNYTGNTQSVINGAITGATNGLTKYDSHNICLGGNLSQNTTISGTTHDFTISSKTLNLCGVNGINICDNSSSGINVNSNGGNVALLGNDSYGIEKIKFLINDTQATIIDNRITKTGIQYGGDYSSTYNNRTLVDKQYVDNKSSGLNPLIAVQVATTTNINIASAPSTIGGVTLINGMRILVKNQISGATNGIYLFNGSGNTLTRTSDFSGNTQVKQNSYVSVISGATNQNTSWILNTPNPIYVGTTILTFVLFSSQSGVVAGNGITINQSGGNYNVAVKLATSCSALCSDSSGLYLNCAVAGTGLAYNNTNGTLSVCGSSLAGNSICWSGNSFNVNVNGGTLNQELTSKVNVSTYCSYTGATNITINNKLNASLFNGYTGTTAPNTYLSTSNFNSYSGITVPNNYYNKTEINNYSGTTKNSIDLKAPITSPTFLVNAKSVTPSQNDNTTCIATTAWYINQASTTNPIMDGSVCIGTSNLFSRQDHIHPSDTSRLSVLSFNNYSGVTVPSTYYNKTQINTYTGNTDTLINNKLNTTTFSNYTGTTVPNTYYNKTEITDLMIAYQIALS